MRKRFPALLAAFAALAIVLSACSSNSETSGPTGTVTGSASQDASLNALLPAKIKTAGKLVIGMNVPYSPVEYLDGSGKVAGFDVDLMNAVANVLGLTPVYTQSDFDKIIPAITAGTYDVGVSAFTDTKAREKTVDFTTYFSAGVQWAAPAGKPVDPNNACGLRVSVQTTTIEDTDEIPAKSKACTAAGKPAIIKVQYDSQDNATNAVIIGRADAMSADSPVTAYAVKQAGGKLIAAGKVFSAAPYGWAIAKGSTLAQSLQKALQSLIANGLYLQICQKWGLQDGAITTAQVNGATS